MRKNYVATLDVRSSEITAVVGERGVNNTFIIKSKCTVPYDGYSDGALFDEENFIAALSEVIRGTLASADKLKSFYVGVPGEFLKLINTDNVITFSSAKRIGKNDLAALEKICAPAEEENFKTIKHSCLYYVLSDKRKVINPVGMLSDSVQGRFCYFKCDKKFIDCVTEAFKKYEEILKINLIPSPYAEAMYLVEPEQRDECAVLFDLGYISSTYNVICGNGLLFSDSYSIGIGHIVYYLMDKLDIPYEVASSFLSTVNLNAKETLNGTEEVVYDGVTYRFPLVTLRDIIREGLDGICEVIDECRKSFSGKNIDGKTLLITGDGVQVIRGDVDHISGRLEKGVEIASPKVPYYDKPKYASLFSLLDISLKDALK